MKPTKQEPQRLSKGKIRMVVCDVNNTLAEVGKPPLPSTVRELRKLEAKGVTLVFASGRAVEYLKGFSRALGLHPVFIGDNGSMIHDFEQYGYKRMAKRLKGINPIRKAIKARYKHNVSFVMQESSHLIEHRFSPEVAAMMVDEVREMTRSLGLDVRVGLSGNGAVYIAPMEVDKGKAIDEIKRIYHVSTDKIVAIGNDANDTPLIDRVGLFVGVGKAVKWGGEVPRFDTVEQALRHINSLC